MCFLGQHSREKAISRRCFHGLDVDLRRSRSDKVFDSIEYIKDHNHMTEGTVEH